MAEKTKKTKQGTKVNGDSRRFMRMTEAAIHYGVGLSSFRKIAYEANAVYRIRKIVLINLDLVDEYLETFREFND